MRSLSKEKRSILSVAVNQACDFSSKYFRARLHLGGGRVQKYKIGVCIIKDSPGLRTTSISQLVYLSFRPIINLLPSCSHINIFQPPIKPHPGTLNFCEIANQKSPQSSRNAPIRVKALANKSANAINCVACLSALSGLERSTGLWRVRKLRKMAEMR